MSMLRWLGKISGGFIFALFLTAAITVTSLTQLLEHDNLESVFASVVSRQFPASELDVVASELRAQCEQKDSVQFSLGDYPIDLNCGEITNSTNSEITAAVFGYIFDQAYFRNYDCSFVECLQRPGAEKFSVLVSANAYKFFGNMQYAMWVGAVLGAILMMLSTETWDGRLKGIGSVLIIAGLPFLVFSQLEKLVLTALPQVPTETVSVVDAAFVSISTNYFIVLILGIALTVAGYAIVIFRKEGAGEKEKR